MLDTFLAGKHNANPLNILVHLKLLCAQRGNELGLCWRVEQTIGSSLITSHCLKIQSVAPSAAVWPEFQCQIMPPPIQPPFGG